MTALDPTRFGFASLGVDVTIFELTRITAPEQISLGDHVVIDDFVLVQGGRGLRIGSYVHIASFASITGGGSASIGAFTGISSGARLFTGTDLADGSGLIGPRIPADVRAVKRSTLELGQHVFIGANTVVLPGLKLGAGAVVGAGSVVTSDLEPWTINVGAPARPVKQRPSETIVRYARQLGIDPDHG